MELKEMEYTMWQQIQRDSRVLDRCERCGVRAELLDSICGTCADMLRDQFDSESAMEEQYGEGYEQYLDPEAVEGP